jgi:hypothetical protein
VAILKRVLVVAVLVAMVAVAIVWRVRGNSGAITVDIAPPPGVTCFAHT